MQTYVRYLPHGEVNPHVVDAWFTYDQFDAFFELAPRQGDRLGSFLTLAILTSAVFFGMLAAMGGMNGVEYSFPVSGYTFLSFFAFRFFMYATNYNDRHYLMWLLGIICVYTGGGSFFLIFTDVEIGMTPEQEASQRNKRQLLIQESEWGAITLRLQFAVVYFYSSLWKLHTDFLQGSILQEHLVGPEELGHDDGTWLYQRVNAIFGSQGFLVMGVSLFLMEFTMFLAMTFRRPTVDTSRQFFIGSLVFYGVQTLVMGHKIGYLYPLVCLAGTLIFHPIGGGSKVAAEIDAATSAQRSAIAKRIRSRQQLEEANLLGWIKRYALGSPEALATRNQQLFTLVWLLIQILLPWRMPIISNGNYAFTAEGFRFSWTDHTHTRQTAIFHTNKNDGVDPLLGPTIQTPDGSRLIPLINLFYFLPECSGKSLHRGDYMPERAVSSEDPRTLPINSILTSQHTFFMRAYPHYSNRVAGGMSLVLHQIKPEPCHQTHVSMYGVHFAKLNGKGPFCRIFDPTINLALVEIMRYHRSLWDVWAGVFLDQAPTGYEYILSKGIGTMTSKVDKHKAEVERSVLGAERIEFIADRAPCLAARPIALWPNGVEVSFMVLEAPSDVTLYITTRSYRKSSQELTSVKAKDLWDELEKTQTQWLYKNQLFSTSSISVEISVDHNDGSDFVDKCGETVEEDILFALIFMP